MDSILIVGTGALACLFAARLAPYTRVTMLGTWTAGIAALRASGVTLVDGDNETTHDIGATDDPHACGKHRFALVLVKSWQTARATEQLDQCLTDDGVALTLQNGYGNLQILQEALSEERVVIGATTMGATLLTPGRVKAGGDGLVHIVRRSSLEPLVSLFQKAEFETEETDDVDSLVWGKLVINVGINPLTAILAIPNGKLLEHAPARELMKAAAREAAAVAESLGVALPFKDPIAAVTEVARKTAANHSSMLQDIGRGAPTEIDATCGAVVRQGELVNVDTPVNRVLWKLVSAMALKGNQS